MTLNPFITPYQGHSPIMAGNAYVDVSARLIGRVKLMDGSSVWPGAVLRADDDEIIIGRNSAVLDQCLVEAPKGKPVIVHDWALISHMVCLHGAEVESGALVGVGRHCPGQCKNKRRLPGGRRRFGSSRYGRSSRSAGPGPAGQGHKGPLNRPRWKTSRSN